MPSQLHRSHADPARGGVHQHPLARADARKVCQRVVRGEERPRVPSLPARRTTPRGCARSSGDPRRQRVPRRRTDPSRGRLARTRAHRRRPRERRRNLRGRRRIRRVTQRDQDITEVHAGAAQTQTHLAGLQGALGFGPRAQDKVPRVQRAVAEGGKPPGARLDKFSALDSLGVRTSRGAKHTPSRSASCDSSRPAVSAIATSALAQSSTSANEMRPGFSVCALRNNPHTAAWPRSVTSSDESTAIAPRVSTTSRASSS